MKGSREVIEMEENGEIELIETSPNYHMGWVNSDNTSTTITGHEYVAIDQKIKELKNDTFKK